MGTRLLASEALVSPRVDAVGQPSGPQRSIPQRELFARLGSDTTASDSIETSGSLATSPASTSSPAASLAKTSASPGSERVSPASEASFSLTLFEYFRSLGLSGSFLRTSLACYRMTPAAQWESFSPRWSSAGTASPTGFSTLSFSVSPNDVSVCSLSDVTLDAGRVPQRFFGSNAQGGQRTTDVRQQNGLGISYGDISYTLDGNSDHAIVQQAISSKWKKGTSGPSGDEHHNLITVGPLTARTGKQGGEDSEGGHYVVANTIVGLNERAGRSDHQQLVASPIETSHSGPRGDGGDTLVVAGTLGAAHARNRGLGQENETDLIIFDDPRRHNDEHRGGIYIEQSPTLAGEPRQWLSAPPDAHRVRDAAGVPAPLDLCSIDEEGPDGYRYHGIGNAIVPDVAEWIFERIEVTTS